MLLTYIPSFPFEDLLNDDYSSAITLKAKKNAGPIGVTIETERSPSGALSSKIGTKMMNVGGTGFNVDKGQLKADGARVLETHVKPYPGVKISFKSSKGADVIVDYTKGNLFATGQLDVLDMSKLSASASFAHASGVTFGGAANYGLSGKTGLTAYDVGVKYAHGPLLASVTSASKLSTFNIGLLYKVNDDVSLASMTTHSGDKICDFGGLGGSYKASFGTVKAKYTGAGQVSASLIKEVAPKVTLTASGTTSLSDFSTFKYGLGIVM